ncbi:thioesterase family protein [Streptantibioticus parmotrematis]|uniref:acyl-CoA thioesterase n=1 Tax=Streptantibioticus parmotrematis TaxID=2873249 RepID=UPI0033EE0A4D
MDRFIYPCPLRWADADLYGHINNVVFHRYMEEARTRMFKNVTEGAEGDQRRHAFVVARSSIEHRSPLHYRDDPVNVSVGVSEVTAATFELSYQIGDADHLYAEATTKIVAYNLHTGRPRRLSDSELAFLASYSRR